MTKLQLSIVSHHIAKNLPRVHDGISILLVFLLAAMFIGAFVMSISLLAIFSPRALAWLLIKWLDLLR